jgi:hypothetical protein
MDARGRWGETLPDSMAPLRIAEADLALLWAALVAFREQLPNEERTTRERVGALLDQLAGEQARRHLPPLERPEGHGHGGAVFGLATVVFPSPAA